MNFLETIGQSQMNAFDPNTRQGQAGLFGTSTLMNLANNIGNSKVDQINAIRGVYDVRDMDSKGMSNLFSQGARVSEASRIQQEADKQRAYANQAYGQTGPEYDQLGASLQEMLKAMKAGNATFGR